MEDFSKATARPWTGDLHHTQMSSGRTYGFIRAGGVVPLAAITLGVEGMSEAEGRANLALIIAAVNAWDKRAELIAALRAICQECDGSAELLAAIDVGDRLLRNLDKKEAA